MGSFGLVIEMTQILTAAEKHEANKVKLAALIKEAQSLYNADYPDNSYNKADVSTTAKNVTPPPASQYQTKQEMIDALVKKGLSSQQAEIAASAVFGDSNKTGKVFAQAKWDLTQKLVNKGFGVAQARMITSDVYGGDTTKGQTIRTSTGITKIPPTGTIKQASVADIAPWAVVSADVDPNATITFDNGLRSASAVPEHWIGESIVDMQHRKADERESRARNAKKNSEDIPYWARLHADVI